MLKDLDVSASADGRQTVLNLLESVLSDLHVSITVDGLEEEDEGDFDAIVANAPPGDGYWALPEEWGVASNMLAGGGITLLNDVPAL